MSRPWKLAAAVLVALVVFGMAVTIGGYPRPRRAFPAPAPHHHPGSSVAVSASVGPVPDAVKPDAAAVEGLPAGQWPLPGPRRYDGVAGVGFPHTTLGALALGYSALVARFTTDPDLAVSVVRATALAPTPAILDQVAGGTEALRVRFGLAPTGPTPTTVGLSLIACRVTSASPSQVVAGYEGTLSVEGGSVAGTTAQVSAAIVLAWNGDDWKIDPAGDLPTPAIDYPTSGVTPAAGGWHVCRET